MAIAKRTGLIVAGMHRSGTSAVARLINLLGADMARDIVPANAWNEDGHWESHPIITLHDRMLETFDARWNSLSGIGEEGLPSIGERRQLVDAIKSVVVEQYGDSSFFVLKDPRICLFLPLWRVALSELGIDAAYVIPFRNPLAVAASLCDRETTVAPGEAWDIDRGGLLWLHYVLAAEFATREQRRVFLRYDDLFEDWLTQARRIAETLHITWPRAISAIEADVQAFINPARRHHAATKLALQRGGPWSRIIGPVFEQLCLAVADPNCGAEAFDAARRELAGARMIFGGYVASQEKNALAMTMARSSEKAEAERCAVIAAERRAAEKAEVERCAIVAAERHAAEKAEVERCAIVAAERHAAEKSAIEAHAADLDAALTRLTAERETLASKFARLENRVAEQADGLTVLAGSLAAMANNLAGTCALLAQRDQEIDRLRADRLSLEAEGTGLTSELVEARALVAARDAQIMHIAAEQQSLAREGETNRFERYQLQIALDAIYRSNSWRLSTPLRLPKLALRAMFNAGSPAQTALHRRFQRSWHDLPLPDSFKQKLKATVFTALPFFFRRTAAFSAWENSTATSRPAKPFPAFSEVPRVASYRREILVAADFLPLFDQSGGALRLKTLIGIMDNAGWSIVLASRHGLAQQPGMSGAPGGQARYEMALRNVGVSQFLYGLTEIDNFLAESGHRLQWAFLSFPQVATDLLPLVRSRCPNAHIAYDMVDFHSLRMTREAALRNDPQILAEAEQQRAIELACAASADVTIAVSGAEKAALLELLPEAVVEVVPLVFELGAWPPPGPAGREGLLFVGGFYHTPNVDAVCWFVERVLPIIRREAPDLVLRIAGANPSEEVLALARHPGVEVLGFVPDLGPLYDRHRVCIAPLRFGAGMKGKVAQSMASGLPIVSTSIGIEGMALEEGTAVLVADGEAEFAAHVVRLLRDDELWLRLSAQGRAFIERTLSVEAVRPLLEAILRG